MAEGLILSSWAAAGRKEKVRIGKVSKAEV
jgi:hypothetical protein